MTARPQTFTAAFDFIIGIREARHVKVLPDSAACQRPPGRGGEEMQETVEGRRRRDVGRDRDRERERERERERIVGPE